MVERTTTRLLGVSVLLMGLATAQPAHAGNGKVALSSLPQDTAMVMSINFDRAKRSSMFKEAMALAMKNGDMAKNIAMLKAQASFDVKRDLKTLTIGFHQDFQQNQQAVMLVEGKFNRAKVMKFVKATAKKVVDLAHRGVKYWLIDDESEVALVKGHLVFAQKGQLASIIDVYKGKAANLRKNTGFMKMMGRTDTTKDMWMVGVIPPSMRAQLQGMLGGSSVDGVTASVDVKKGMVTKMSMAASDSNAAKSLVALMQAGLSQASSDPSLQALGLAGAMKKVTIKANANNVDVGMSLSDAELNKIKNLLKSFM